MTTVGERLAHAIAAKDRDGVRGLLAPDVDFRGLTPSRAWEADSADAVVSVLFDCWFEDSDEITGVLDVAPGSEVADTERVSYRFALHNDDGDQVAEQQAYYRAVDGRIGYLRVLCSGFRPAAATPA